MSALAAVGAGTAELIHRAGVALVLAQPGDPDPSNGKGPEWGKAAPIGLLVIALLCIALFFLVKSMNKRIKRVPASFVPPATGATQGVAAVPGATGDVTPAAPARSGPPTAGRDTAHPAGPTT